MIRYRQSNLKHYFDCPQKFFLSQQIPYGEPSMPMRYGLIFENLVLGDKPNHDPNDWKKNVLGRIKPETIAEIQSHADIVKPLFLEGAAFVDLELVKDEYKITGEADFIGRVKVDEYEVTGIIDLKYTGNIASEWLERRSKRDLLQSVVYPYLYWKATDVLLPFIYKVVENTSGLVLTIVVDVNEEDFAWFEEFIEQVHKDMFYEALPSHDKCLGYKGRDKCQYLEHCPYGKQLIATTKTYNFSQLVKF